VQTIVETPTFQRQADALLSQEERLALLTVIAENPAAGDLIPRTGGVRKLRFGRAGVGKRGGVRAIFYWYDADAPIYALLVYGKGERDDLTPDQTIAVARFAAAIKAERRQS
jgi:hypothetical protein